MHGEEPSIISGVRQIYVASSNPGKLADFAAAAQAYAIHVLPLPGVEQIVPPEETGSTFEENARLKAEYYSRHAPEKILVADDSGLVVAALHGDPGVRSARYAEDAGIIGNDPDDNNNRLLLQRMERVPNAQRQCAFICVLAPAHNGKTLAAFTGKARGMLLREPRGSNGFGYDPLFFFPDMGRSFAELSREQKLRVSHRGMAFRSFLDWMSSRAET